MSTLSQGLNSYKTPPKRAMCLVGSSGLRGSLTFC